MLWPDFKPGVHNYEALSIGEFLPQKYNIIVCRKFEKRTTIEIVLERLVNGQYVYEATYNNFDGINFVSGNEYRIVINTENGNIHDQYIISDIREEILDLPI